MNRCNLVDRLWFDAHPDEDHRIRPANAMEASAFENGPPPGFPRLLTVIRASDGATATYAFREGDDIDRAASFELGAWFADDLNKVPIAGPSDRRN